MTSERTARKALIVKMMMGYPSSASNITDDNINAYLEAAADVSIDALARAAKQFLTGRVDGHNNAFMPTAPSLASNARAWDEAIASVTASQELAKLGKLTTYRIGEKPPEGTEPLGPTKIEIKGILTDVSDLSHAEKEEIMRTGERTKPAGGILPKMKRV